MSSPFHVALPLAALIIAALYAHVGYANLRTVYSRWFDREYWVAYNVVEFVSWVAKLVIIVPGLIFGVEVWWAHLVTLVTSASLVWASEKKSLPTLVAFNSIWIVISTVVLTKNVMRMLA